MRYFTFLVFTLLVNILVKGQGSFNISIDSVKVLRDQNGIKCSNLHDFVIYWTVSKSSGSATSYPSCQTGAIITASTSGGSDFTDTGIKKYSGMLDWVLFEGTYYGIQYDNIPLGSYRDTLTILTPSAISAIFSSSAQVSPSSGSASGCLAGTNTNTTAGNDDVKTNLDTVVYCPALPIELKSFSVSEGVDLSDLRWSSGNEYLFSGFEVQHSDDGQNFHKIGFVEKFGANSDYSFMHNNPLKALNYYRLKMLDLDGSYVYSDIKVIDFSTERSSEFIIFPNPFHEGFTINGLAKGDQLKIYDLTGKLVYQNNAITDQVLRIDLTNVEPGLYNVLVISGEDVKTTKLLKVE